MKKLYASLMLALLLTSFSVNVVFAMTGRDFKNLQKVYTNPYTGKPFVYDPGGSSSISESTAELGSGRALYNDRVRAGGYNSGPSNTGVPSGNITPTQQSDPNAAPLPKITFGLPPDSPFHPDNFNKGPKSKDNNDRPDGKDNNGSVSGNVNGSSNGGNGGGNNEKGWSDKLWDDTKIFGGSIWGGIKKIGGGIKDGTIWIGNKAKGVGKWIWSAAGTTWDGVKNTGKAIGSAISKAVSGVGKFIVLNGRPRLVYAVSFVPLSLLVLFYFKKNNIPKARVSGNTYDTGVSYSDIDLDGGKVYIVARELESVSGGTHVFLVIESSRVGGFGMKDKAQWTLGGYVEKGMLVKEINAATDKNAFITGYSVPDHELGKIKDIVEVVCPKGISSKEFIGSIMIAYNEYEGDALYDPFVNNGYNSNIFAGTILTRAGVKDLPWDGNAPGIDPGYGEILPQQYKKTGKTNDIPGSVPNSSVPVGRYSGREVVKFSTGKISELVVLVKSSINFFKHD